MITIEQFYTAVLGGIGTLVLKGFYDWIKNLYKLDNIRSLIKTDLEDQLKNLDLFADELIKIQAAAFHIQEHPFVPNFLNKLIKSTLLLKGMNYLATDVFKSNNLLEYHKAFPPLEFVKLKEIYRVLDSIYDKSPLQFYTHVYNDVLLLHKENSDQMDVLFFETIDKHEKEFNYKLRTVKNITPHIQKFIKGNYYNYY